MRCGQREPPDRAIAWVSQLLGGPMRSVRALTGGMESTLDVLVPERGGPVVMRRYLDLNAYDDAVALARREAAVLRALEPTSVPAPRLVAIDPNGEHCGAPSVVMEFMPGTREVPDDLRTLAAELARTMAMIHDVSFASIEDLPDVTERILSAWSDDRTGVPGNASSTTMRSLAHEQPPRAPDIGPRTLIHDDFAPHNTLFVGDRLSAVVDWADAAAGQPEYAVCFCRLNVALVWGLDAGEMVLEAYEAQIGTPLPDRGWWDLMAAVRVKPDLDNWTRSANYLGPPNVTVQDVSDRFNCFVANAQSAS